MIRWIGLIAGPIVAAVIYFLAPDTFNGGVAFTTGGKMTLGALAWMGIWWMSEAIPLPATALLPLVIFPFLGIATIKDAASPFSSPLIYLFLGGFLMAATMQRWGLDKRIALMVLRAVGSSPRKIVFAFMLVAAIFSAFVSSTSTAAWHCIRRLDWRARDHHWFTAKWICRAIFSKRVRHASQFS